MTDSSTRICPWCSSAIPEGATACPKCGAPVEGATVTEITGITVPDAKSSLAPDGATLSDEAIQLPSDAVRFEMRKMELEAEIENAGGVVLDPTGDEAMDVGRPSREAIEALEAGLLDVTGPAGETNPAETAGESELRHD